MILVLVLSVAFAALIAAYVLQPLTTGANQNVFAYSHRGFADEQELRAVLELRDATLHKLVFGNSAHPALAGLNKENCFEVLVSLCLRLQRAELPFLPSSVATPEPDFAHLKAAAPSTVTDQKTTSVGSAGTVLTVLLAGFVAAAANMSAPSAQAQALAPEHGQGHGQNQGQPQPGMPQIPPAYITDKNIWVPQVSQFVLSPRMGELHVFYLGVFSNPQGASQARISIPLPQGFQNLKLLNLPNAVLSETSNGMPVFEAAVAPGLTEIRAEFDLDAAFGKVQWENSAVPSMPGTTLMLLPEYDSLLHSAFETFLPDFNLWPARIADAPTDFRSTRSQEQVDPQDPNYEMLAKMPPQFTRNLVRSSAVPRPYPAFQVVGIVPSRTPLYVLVVLIGALLFSVAVYTIVQVGKQKNPLPLAKT